MQSQGEQLRRDLNVIVGTGKNWKIPSWWPFVLRYVNGPLLCIVYSFSYPNFNDPGKNRNPVHIFGFFVAHLTIMLVALGFIVPRWFNIVVPRERREDGNKLFAPNVTLGLDGVDSGSDSMEAGRDKVEPEMQDYDVNNRKEMPVTNDREYRGQ